MTSRHTRRTHAALWEVHVLRNRNVPPTADTNLPAMRMNHLGNGSLTPVKPSGDSSPLVYKTSGWGLRHHGGETRYPYCAPVWINNQRSYAKKKMNIIVSSHWSAKVIGDIAVHLHLLTSIDREVTTSQGSSFHLMPDSLRQKHRGGLPSWFWRLPAPSSPRSCPWPSAKTRLLPPLPIQEIKLQFQKACLTWKHQQESSISLYL